MLITNSPDLGVLEVLVSIDLTGTAPVINLTNQTTANPNVSPIPSLNTLQWVLNIFSPTGTPIYQSDFNTPWQTGVWTTQQITAAWPRPFGQIEWSGADYLIQFQVKDTVGTIYDLDKAATICRPVGNTQKSTNTFGVVALSVETLCDAANLYIKDNTSKTYKGITGILASSYMAIDYPRDPTGVKPDPFIITSFTSDALIPFTFNAKGYEATYYSIYTYDLGNNVFLQIRYTAQVLFDVLCNIDLCPLACEVQSLEESIQSGNCANVQAAQAKLNLITPKLLRAFIAKANPTCGIDLAELIEEIKEIGGFSCDCYGGTTGISTSAVGNDFIFSVNNQGGDVVATFQQTGGNVVLNIKDRSYTFGPTTGSQAILLVPTIGNTNTNVGLSVNLNTLATDIYNETANNSTLLNLFNSLVINGGFTLVVDGKCVINNGACDYVFTLANIPDTPVSSFIAAIQSSIPANNKTLLNFAFNLSTLPALQNYLNTLGIGTFVVANAGGGNVTITTNNNNFGLTNIVYSAGGNNKTFAAITIDCTGTLPLTPSQIVQAIIDYLCALDDSQIVTSQDYTVCYINPVTKKEETVIVPAGTALTDFILALLAKGCDTINYIINNSTGLDCTNIKTLFAPSTKIMQGNDFVLGTKGGDCARIFPVEFGTRMLQMGITDVDFMDAFCAAVQLCAGGNMCAPYSAFSLSTVENSPIDNKLDIIVTFTHPAAVDNILRYARTDLGGTLTWVTIPSVLPGASPYTIANVDDGQYVVGLTPIYADGRKCGETILNTGSCGLITAMTAILSGSNIVVSYTAPVTVPKVRLTINYPNGSVSTTVYNNTGTDITIPIALDMTGNYTITMQSVCNLTTGWFSTPTAPAVITVQANNSFITNNSASNISSTFYVTYTIGANPSVNILTAPNLLAGTSRGIFLADGFYDQITVFGPTVFSAIGHSATLTTATGVTVGVFSGGLGLHIIQFNNVQILNGAVISLIDTSP